MPLRFTIWALSGFLFVFSASAWAAPEATSATDYAGQFVTTLETWDKEKNQPAQPKVDGVKIVTQEETVGGKSPGSSMRLVVNYPQGTGSPEVDKLLKERANMAMANFRKVATSFTVEGTPKPGIQSRTFLVSKSMDRYLSVLFYDYVDRADDFPHWVYESVTFDLEQGRQLTVEDAFPDSDEGLKIPGFFVNYINAFLDNKCLVSGEDCWPSAIELKKTEHSGDRHMVITPEGVAVIFGPYELGEMVEDTQFLNVPKKKMVEWGMRDYFWIDR